MKKSDRSYNSTDLRKVVLNKEEWVAQVDSIRAMVKTGATLEYLGKHYGVSRQRMHQVMRQLDIDPFQSEAGFISPTKKILQKRGTKKVNELHKRVLDRMGDL
jgi:hypothetical protein